MKSRILTPEEITALRNQKKKNNKYLAAVLRDKEQDAPKLDDSDKTDLINKNLDKENNRD